MNCIALHCTALHCTALHKTSPNCTKLQYTKPVIESGPNLSLTTVFSSLATPFLGPAYATTVLLGSANNLVHHVLNCFLLLPRHSVEARPLEGLLTTVCKKCAAKLPTSPTNSIQCHTIWYYPNRPKTIIVNPLKCNNNKALSGINCAF